MKNIAIMGSSGGAGKDTVADIITDITDYSGRRLYQYAREFDYIEWLNE